MRLAVYIAVPIAVLLVSAPTNPMLHAADDASTASDAIIERAITDEDLSLYIIQQR